MAGIRLLTPSMINKIAAGEVIERPASVVKELVENSLDAGAGRIEVTVEKAGRDRLMVVDNGRGIAKEELLLALSPHATSKISEADDLFSICSFGFRGEALASIAEISQLTLQSRTPGEVEGTRIEAEGQKRSQPVPCGMAPGTSIDVRNLFFNTPVRRRYLKTDTTEFGHICEAFIRLALPNTDVHFLLRHNGRVVYDLAPAGQGTSAKDPFLTRIEQIYSHEITGRLLPIDFSNELLTIRGFVGHPDLSRTTASMQYFFLNRRWIRDRALHHALQEAYRGLLTVGRCPVAFLMIELDPNLVDVNVHPAKLEVRFLQPQMVYSGFLGAVRQKFLQTDLRSRPAQAPENSPCDPGAEEAPSEPRASVSPGPGILSLTRTPSSPGRSAAIAPAPPRTSAPTYPPAQTPKRRFDEDRGDGEESFDTLRRRAVAWARQGTGGQDDSGGAAFAQAAQPEPFLPEAREEGFARDEETPNLPALAEVIQIHQKYLVFQTETGMALVDQHALHERILYEKLKRKLCVGALDAQRLLVPEMVELSAVETALALENCDLFEKFGVSIESFGGRTISISSYPAILEKLGPRDIFLTLLAVLSKKGKETERADLLEEMMHQSSCKAAVKGGDYIDRDQIAELLKLAREEARTDHCPHGRPTTLLFSLQELDRLFKRT